MNEKLMQQFIQLICVNTGLYIREQDRQSLHEKLGKRMRSLQLSEPEDYYQILHNFNNQNNSSEINFKNEWRELTFLLTVGESYFFRDREQLSIIKHQILPEAIERKRRMQSAKGDAKPSLRLWSAGCSTGEEAYSLAILVKELIPDYDKWNIFILGTDINPKSIEKAKQGLYNHWSFRLVESGLQRQYFHQHKTDWEVNEQIRKIVTFYPGNLVRDVFPTSVSDVQNMDIILCRNVFIYFDFKTISIVLEKFCNTLRPGGYLITGHSELHGQNLGRLQTKVFPGSIVYQRIEDLHKAISLTTLASQNLSSSKTATWFAGVKCSALQSKSISVKKSLAEITSSTLLSEVETLFHNGAYTHAIEKAEQVIKENPCHPGAHFLMAQSLANLGEYEKAIFHCQQVIKLDSVSVNPYYLLARIFEEQGNTEKSIEYLKKVVYLSPSSITVYLELGSLYEKEGESRKAKKMRNTAFELLKELPTRASVEYQNEITAGELLLHVEKLLNNNP